MPIFLVFLIFIVLFVLALRFAIMFIGKVTDKAVGEKYRAAEEIIETGKVPKDWTDKLERGICLAGNTSEMQRQAKRIILKRLDNLIKYFKESPLVEDQETRKILLSELQRVHNLWREKKPQPRKEGSLMEGPD